MALLSGNFSRALAPSSPRRPRSAGLSLPLTVFAGRRGHTRRDSGAAIAAGATLRSRVTRLASSLHAGAAALECAADDDGCQEEGAVTVRDDLESLLTVLPPGLRSVVATHPRRAELVEVVLDLGRPPEIRGAHGYREVLRADEITAAELEAAASAVGNFGGDNRAGISGAQCRARDECDAHQQLQARYTASPRYATVAETSSASPAASVAPFLGTRIWFAIFYRRESRCFSSGACSREVGLGCGSCGDAACSFPASARLESESQAYFETLLACFPWSLADGW